MIFQNRGVAGRHLPAFASRSGALALVLALAACGGGGSNSSLSAAALAGAASPGATPTATTDVALDAATVKCWGPDGPNTVAVKPKTITVHNNSDATIYPVLATSTNDTNEWVQGCFHSKDPYSAKLVYKLFVNAGKGIPKNSSVTITLPLYSQLATKEYITWWNGGRVVLADKNDRLLDAQVDTKLQESPGGVSCRGENTGCDLSVYSSAVQFTADVYAQLSEYTFGDSILVDGVRRLKTDNVGYNISYVDHVYMPVAMAPKNNPYIGYSGAATSLADFRSTLRSFLDSPAGQGWPVYNLGELKLPGAYNVFAERDARLKNMDAPVKAVDGKNPPVLTVLSCLKGECGGAEYGQAVQRMQDLWGTCVTDWGGSEQAFVTPGKTVQCPQKLKDDLAAVKQFFAQNHAKYVELRKTCNPPKEVPEVPFTFMTAMTHIYGWVPFNEGCGAGANRLADTTIPGWDHAKIQSMYIHDLQYGGSDQSVASNPDLEFNPYVNLIHKDLGLTAYGFSVDDAVGFMSELGDGLIFAVGGTAGLENGKAFDYRDGFSVSIGVPKYLEKQITVPLIKKYGVCAFNQDANDKNCEKDKQDVIMPVNNQIAGFRVGTVPSYPIKVRFTDLDSNLYTFVVKEKFAVCPLGSTCATNPSNWNALKANFDCSVLTKDGAKHGKSDQWCGSFNPNQANTEKQLQTVANTASFAHPVDQPD